VTLAHEALITHWDELSAWIETYRGDLLARQRLAEQTQLWIEGGKKKNYLLSEARLTEAQRVAAGECFLLDSNEGAFLQQSKQRVKKRLRALQASLAAFALLVVVAAGFGLMARSQSSRAERGEKKANQSIEKRMKHSARTDLR